MFIDFSDFDFIVVESDADLLKSTVTVTVNNMQR